MRALDTQKMIHACMPIHLGITRKNETNNEKASARERCKREKRGLLTMVGDMVDLPSPIHFYIQLKKPPPKIPNHSNQNHDFKRFQCHPLYHKISTQEKKCIPPIKKEKTLLSTTTYMFTALHHIPQLCHFFFSD